MSKFKFIIVSKDENFMMDINPSENVDVIKVANNKENITRVYNRFLDGEKANKTCDFMIFMHSDVKFDVDSLISHIEECKEKYDMMGLCGCAKISVSQKPLNWFCGSRPFPEFRWGCVTHGELNNQTSYFSSHSPETMDHEVSCIDGLCIIFGENAINSDLRFDEGLRFNCYDTQISFSCVIEKKMRLGVLVEKSLQHYSVGKSILTDDFQIDEKVLRERFHIQDV